MAGKPFKYVHSYGAEIVGDKPEAQLPKAPIIGDDPLNSFDHYHWKEQTDLGAWMTYDPEQRAKLCRKFGNDKKNMDRRHKNLVYIIFMESAHKNGSYRVARMAFDFLFLGHKDLTPDAS